MPTLPAVSKVVRIDHHFSQAADPNMMIRAFFQYSGTLSSTDATTWLTNAVTGLGAHFMNQIETDMSLVGSELTDLTSTSAPQVQNSTGITGTGASNPLPAGVAMVMKFHINRRYRGGHPRVYLPGMAQGFLSTPTKWDSSTLANITAGYIAYVAAVTANTNPAAIGTITQVNVSYFQGFTNHTYPSGRVKAIPTPRVTPVVDQVINISGNPFPASQRRRNQQP